MKLPEKLKAGDDFKGGVFEKINALIDYCKSSEIRGDNRTVRINRTPSGITISALSQNRQAASGGGSLEYIGPFCVELESGTAEDGTEQLIMKCRNSSLFNNSSYPAGGIKNGNRIISVPYTEMMLESENAVVYAAVIYIPESDSLTGRILVSYDGQEPEPEAGARCWTYTIARIVDGGVVQVHQGTDISITGVWTNDLF